MHNQIPPIPPDLARVNTLMHELDGLIWRDGEGRGNGTQQADQRRTIARLSRLRTKPSLKVLAHPDVDVGQLDPTRQCQRAAFGKFVADPLRTDFDLALLSVYWFRKYPILFDALARIKRNDDDPRITCIYMRDNHHMYGMNLRLALAVDVVAPGHAYKTHYLRAANLCILESGAMGVNQFQPGDAAAFYAAFRDRARSDRLYGSYSHHPHFAERTAFLDQCASMDASDVVQWRPQTPGTPYGDLSAQERFKQWMAYKTSLVVNTDYCIPIRLFDALLTGQIPIVPRSLVGIRRVFSREEIETLPIIFYDEATTEAVNAARIEAVHAFDQGGAAAADARHQRALHNFMSGHSWHRIYSDLMDFA